jgi:hypothetical protein
MKDHFYEYHISYYKHQEANQSNKHAEIHLALVEE